MVKGIVKKQNTKDETRRFGVVLENIDSKLDLVVEGQEALSEKMDKNHQEFKEFRDEVNYKFEVVFDELRIIRNELKEKISRDEFSLLEKRVIKLEKRLTTAK